MWDGIKACVESKNLKELEAELSKKAGVEGFIWKKTANTAAKMMFLKTSARKNASRLFGKPPATVWENMCGFNKYPERKLLLPAAISCAQNLSILLPKVPWFAGRPSS
ncbi:MAG: hypothetical protein ACLR2G_04530 [Phascolarctobacterium faecium]